MMEWNPITTAPKSEPILVTDGYSVFAGRLSRHEYANGNYDVVFSGENLADLSEEHMFQEELTGWLPASKTMWEPQKTGDQMLQDLGYKKVKENELLTIYEDMAGFRILLKFLGGRRPGNMVALATSAATGACEFSENEILALAQMVREMEEKENAAD